MKKVIALFLCLSLLLALTACSVQSEATETEPEPEKIQLTPENISNFLEFSINVDDSDVKESSLYGWTVQTGKATISIKATKMQDVTFENLSLTVRLKMDSYGKDEEGDWIGWSFDSGAFEDDIGWLCKDIYLTIAYDGTVVSDPCYLTFRRSSPDFAAWEPDDFNSRGIRFIDVLEVTGNVVANAGTNLIVTESTTAETYATTVAPTT